MGIINLADTSVTDPEVGWDVSSVHITVEPLYVIQVD